MSYRIYITDSIMMLVENKHFAQRWYDIIRPNVMDSRTGDEIAADVIKRAGLRQKGGENDEFI